MPKGNYYYDKKTFEVYTSSDLNQLPRDIKSRISMAPEGSVIVNGEGKAVMLNSSIKDIKNEQDTEMIINLVNKHHDEVKAQELEKEKIRLDEEKKHEYARRIQRMKEESLKEREEFILEVKETLSNVGRIALKVDIVAGVVVAIYAVYTLARATQAVDIEHGVRIIDSAGTRWFEFGEPTNAEYNAGFWSQVEQDLEFIKGLFGR